MFQGKEVNVKLSEEADKVYQELNKIVGEEKLKGINSSFHQTLLRSIIRVKVPKRQMPPKYIQKFDVDNVWTSRCFTNFPSLGSERAS